jgi:hypothetical protein
VSRATVAMWAFSAGVVFGLHVVWLEATAHQYVRAPGASTVTRKQRKRRSQD